jgi:hypothetical protein
MYVHNCHYDVSAANLYACSTSIACLAAVVAAMTQLMLALLPVAARWQLVASC